MKNSGERSSFYDIAGRLSTNKRKNTFQKLVDSRKVSAALVVSFMILVAPTTTLIVFTPQISLATFPGNAGKIAFMSDRDDNDEIYVMNADGSGVTKLTNNASVDQFPRWSPDGTKIAFDTNRDTVGDIYVMNADGTGQTRVTNGSAFDRASAWSPDGSMMAFVSDRDGNDEIYTMNSDGTGVTRLTNDTAFDGHPDWSPEGTLIAFVSTRSGSTDVYVMNTDGSGQTNISNHTASDFTPNWSPDGTKIAFISDRDGSPEIYSMNADGSGVTRLTNNSDFDTLPRWSPDGTTITFMTDRDGNFEIYLMNADGTSQVNLTNNAATDFHPDFGSIAPPTIAFDQATYSSSDFPVITVTDPLLDTDPDAVDSINLTRVYSDSDLVGLDDVLLDETGSNTKVFVGNISLSTSVMAGHLFVKNGDTITAEYTHTDTYGNALDITATATITGSSPPPTNNTGTVAVAGTECTCDWQATNGEVISASMDSLSSTLTININATADGELILSIPRALLDSVMNGTDADFVVFVDEQEVTHEDDFGPTVRTLTIPFEVGSEVIEIIGTQNGTCDSPPSSEISVTTDKTSYTTGETVMVSGNVGEVSINATDVVNVTSVALRDIEGNVIEFQPGTQSIISFTLTNLEDSDQPFAATVQVRKSDGAPELVAWQTGTLAASGSVQIGLSWTPEADDDYTIRILVFRDLTSLEPLYRGAVYDVRNEVLTVNDFDSQAVIRVMNPVDVIYRFEQVEVFPDGSFADSFPMGGSLALEGNYTVLAIYGDNSAQTVFSFTAAGGPTIAIEVSDTNPPWEVDVFANVTVTVAQAGDYVVVDQGNGLTFTHPAFNDTFDGPIELTVFSYNITEIGTTFNVSATLFNSSGNQLASSNIVPVTPDRREASLTVRLPSSIANGTIFTPSGNLADQITGFGLPNRTITFTSILGLFIPNANTNGIEVVDPNGIEIVSCPVPQCTPDNPNASFVNLLKLHPGNGTIIFSPPGVTAMGLTIQDLNGTVTVRVTRSDGSFYLATSDPAGMGIATFLLSARDSGHSTQFLQSVEILSTSSGELFATSKIELYDADADPSTLVSATFDLLPAQSYGTEITILPGAYYVSAVAPILVISSIPVTAQFAGDNLYKPVAANASFATELGFPLGAGLGTLPAIYANPNPAFTVISCSAADPDDDGDGLCNSWETTGIPYACGGSTCTFVLPTTTVPGTRTVQTISKDHKDIFVEIDAMNGQGPLDGALRRVIDAFAAAPVDNPDGNPGVTLHIIKDEMNLTFVGALGLGGTLFNAWVDPVPSGDDGIKTNDYFGVKGEHYGTTVDERTDPALKNARANAIRYNLWVSSIGESTTSGFSEYLGNDMIVSLGYFNGAVNVNGGNTGTETEQAATFMHEAGHWLNLKHGGPAEIITKITGTQVDIATKASGKTRTTYPRETTLGGYTFNAMGPGSGTINMQQSVQFSGAVSGISSLAVTEDPLVVDSKLGTPSISIDGASTTTKKIFNIQYPFEIPYTNPIESIDYAVDFGTPNTGKYLQAGSNTVYDIGTGDFWMAGMFNRMSDSGTAELIVAKRNNLLTTNAGYYVTINSSDQLEVVFCDGSATRILLALSSVTVSTNIWYAWGASFDRDGNMNLWLYNSNTGIVSSTSTSISTQRNSATNTQTFTIARNSAASNLFFSGMMDNLIPPQIGQTLTEAQFRDFATTGTIPGLTPTSKYDFNGRNTEDVIGANDLTANGFPTFPPNTVDASVDNTVTELSLGTLKINFNVSPNVNIQTFGTPAYPSVTELIPQDSGTNCKPNYHSLLSYSRQMDNYLNLLGEHSLDYSRGNFAPLIETDLNEDLGLFSRDILGYPYNVIIYGSPAGVGDENKFKKEQSYGPEVPAIKIDWDVSGLASGEHSQANINNLSITGCDVGGVDSLDSVTFFDYNDWNNINLNWKENPLGTFDGITKAPQKASVEMTKQVDDDIRNQITTIQVDTVSKDKISYGETIDVSGRTSNAPENAVLSIDWGDGTTDLFLGAIDPLTGKWPTSGLLSHTYGTSAIGERRIFTSLIDSGGIVQASSSGTTVLVLKDSTATSLTLTPAVIAQTQQFTLTGTLSNLDHAGVGVAGRTITFTTSDPSLVIEPATTDASGNFMQTAISNIVGTFEIVAHFEPPTDTAEDVVMLPSDSPPQTLVVGEISFSDVLPPINTDGTSVFKQKSTVPIKFRLADAAGNPITDAVATLRVIKIGSGVIGTEEEAFFAGTASSGSVFLHDAANNQYFYNLGTKNMAVGEWGIRVYLNFGTPSQLLLDTNGDGYTAKISLRK